MTSIEEATRRHRWQIIAGLALTIGVGSLPFPLWLDELHSVGTMLATELVYWTLVALTLAYVLGIEKRGLESIGLGFPRWFDLPLAFVVAALVLAALGAIYFFIFPNLNLGETGKVDSLHVAPTWWLIISVVRAGFSEEILFRGYPMTRIAEWTGSKVGAFLVPLMAFSLAHVTSWGWSHFIVAAAGGALFGIAFLLRGNLWANIFAHCAVDGLLLFAA